jgi:hypothetical protein
VILCHCGTVDPDTVNETPGLIPEPVQGGDTVFKNLANHQLDLNICPSALRLHTRGQCTRPGSFIRQWSPWCKRQMASQFPYIEHS